MFLIKSILIKSKKVKKCNIFYEIFQKFAFNFFITILSTKKLSGYSIFISFPLYLIKVLHNSNMTNFFN